MEEAQQRHEYPIDTETLAKGSIITSGMITAAFGVKLDSSKYQLRLLQLREYITRRLAERGERVVVAQRQNDLVILTDEEAVAYTANEFRAGLRKTILNHTRTQDIDRANLSETRLQMHDRELEIQGRMVEAIRSAKASPTAIPSRRATPLVIGDEDVSSDKEKPEQTSSEQRTS